METLKTIVEHFDDFLKRSLLPSSTFILMLFVYDTVLNGTKIFDKLNEVQSTILVITILIAFVGLSTVLSIINQAIFDNRIKKDYDSMFLFTDENKVFTELREKVNIKLEGKYTDYNLYQMIGKSEDTKHYADAAKSNGIFFTSLILVIFISMVSLLKCGDYLSSMALLLFIVLSYFVGLEFVKSRYRSRARRTYTNYLERVDKEST